VTTSGKEHRRRRAQVFRGDQPGVVPAPRDPRRRATSADIIGLGRSRCQLEEWRTSTRDDARAFELPLLVARRPRASTPRQDAPNYAQPVI
jgi:hypothetical protein